VSGSEENINLSKDVWNVSGASGEVLRADTPLLCCGSPADQNNMRGLRNGARKGEEFVQKYDAVYGI
jgi:hypothetical protein